MLADSSAIHGLSQEQLVVQNSFATRVTAVLAPEIGVSSDLAPVTQPK
jgi:hypothetical protein